MRVSALAVSLALVASSLTSCGDQTSYPSRPIFIICPWKAGGGTDAVSRQMAAYLEHEMKVPVNVVNATGGAGVTGHSRGARARPDGHTLLMMTVEINMLHWRGLTELNWKDYEPVMLVNRDAAAVFVRADSPWMTLPDLQKSISEADGADRLTASGTATGGIWHLALAGWLAATGGAPTDVKWIPSQGAAPSLAELMSSGVDMVCCSVPEAASQLKSNQIRCLGVMSDQPVKGFETLPSFPGMHVPWTMGGWRGLGLPKDTPREIVDQVVDVVRRIVSGEVSLNGKTFPEFMDLRGFDASWELPDDFKKTLTTTDEALGKLLRRAEFASLLNAPVPAMMFPSMIGIGLLIAGLVLLATRRSNRAAVEANRAAAVVEDTVPLSIAVVRFVEVVASVVFYCFVAEWLGFVLTSAIILAYLLLRLGTRLVPALLMTVIFVPLVYSLFAKGLAVNLPHGLLGW